MEFLKKITNLLFNYINNNNDINYDDEIQLDKMLLFTGISKILLIENHDNKGIEEIYNVEDIETISRHLKSIYWIGYPDDASTTEDQKSVIEDADQKQNYDDHIGIYVHTLTGKKITIIVKSDGKIEDIKSLIFYQEGIPPNEQRLLFAGEILEDPFRIKAHYKIYEKSTLHLILRLRGGGVINYKWPYCTVHLNDNDLSPIHNHIFHQIRPIIKMIGNENYDRPSKCWIQFALNIEQFNKLDGNSNWIGNGNDIGEWPVSYHGVGRVNKHIYNNTIGYDGYQLSKKLGYPFGEGVFTSPQIEIASKYATTFS